MRLAALEEEVQELRLKNEYLEKKLTEQKQIEIGKVVYKIQELSIDTLSGILNVGISATNAGEQERWIEELIQEKKVDWNLDHMKTEKTETHDGKNISS